MATRTRVRSHRSKSVAGEITTSQVANRLHCSIARAESLVRSGRIFGRHTARGWVTTEAAIGVFVMQRATPLDRPSSTSP